MAEAPSHIKVVDMNGVMHVEFSDRKILDELSINEILNELVALVESQPEIKLLLNFDNVDHLSSAALGMLITLNKRVADAGGKLRLANISPQIYEVFAITRLNKLFDIHDSADAALRSF